MEPAVAGLRPPLHDEVVPSAAAKGGAAPLVRMGAVAEPAAGALDVQRLVLLAEVGRLLVVEEVVPEAAFLLLLGGPLLQLGALLALLLVGPAGFGVSVGEVGLVDEDRRSELVLERFADDAEIWNGPPAGLHLAAAR